MSNSHPGRILAQDIVADDGSGDTLTAMPFGQTEIEELLYGDDRPVQERIARLQEVAAALRDEEPSDFGGGDTKSLLGEVEEAIARLTSGLERDGDLPEEPSMDDDPLNHRETLSPDSDELEEIKEEDEASMAKDDEA